MWCYIVERIGGRTIEELQAVMSVSEFQVWRARCSPLSSHHRREDHLFAKIAHELFLLRATMGGLMDHEKDRKLEDSLLKLVAKDEVGLNEGANAVDELSTKPHHLLTDEDKKILRERALERGKMWKAYAEGWKKREEYLRKAEENRRKAVANSPSRKKLVPPTVMGKAVITRRPPKFGSAYKPPKRQG